MSNSLRILGISVLLSLPVVAANAADMPSGGKLSDTDEGCSVGLRFNPADGMEVPQSLAGEVELSTDGLALLKLKPYLSWVSLQWAAPDDQ